MRKYIVIAAAAVLCSLQLAFAVPARPGKFTAVQPDGTRLTLERRGDEWGHWLVNASGQMVRQDADGFYRLVPDAEASEIRNRVSARRMERNQARVRYRAAGEGRNAVVGQRHFLVILVEFNDLSFKEENDSLAFANMLNEPGYSRNGGTGSARDFYYDNSHGRFEPVFDVFGPVKLDKKHSYYGANDSSGNDRHPEDAVVEGCKALDDEVDFSIYDSDGDGTVDLVFMFYAGYGEADGGGSDTIWPHQWDVSFSTNLTLDGVRIGPYACSNELVNYGILKGKMCGIGTACHEFGHAMGLPDFYDTDDNGSGGLAGGLYSYSTMDGGPYNNEGRTPPYFNFEERMLLGWVKESDYRVFEKSGEYTIAPIDRNVAYRTFTDMDGEYFVYENRTKTGWDTYLPAEGMVVYHVDKSSRVVSRGMTAGELWENWESYNNINAFGAHPCFYIIPAASQSSLNYYYEAQIPFPYGNTTSYVPVSWNGEEGPVSFSQIGHAGGLVTLRAVVRTGELDYPTIADAGSYKAGDRFTFDLVCPEGVDAPASVVWYYDDEPAGAGAVTLTAGLHTIEARLVTAEGRQEVLTLEITVE